MSTRLVAGCMTGTSIDSLDAALVEVSGRGLEVRARFVRGVSRPLGALAARLRAAAEQQARSAGELAGLSREFSLLHAAVLRELCGSSKSTGGAAAEESGQSGGHEGGLTGGTGLHLAAIHGQTVFHAPPVSWQMLTPAVIARAVGCAVVSDLRAADLAAGGQGAPITPLADWVFFRSLAPAAVVNLGGFCNITVLAEGATPEGTEGRDVCPCNHLLDGIARRLLGAGYDEGGRAAMTGSVHAGALEALLAVIAGQGGVRGGRGGRRSLGTGDECGAWIERWAGAGVPAADLGATACEGIARAVALAVRPPGAGVPVGHILLAGGGTRNLALARAIETACAGARVERVDAHGLPAEFREAAEMAVLGALCEDRVPITLARVTGWSGGAPVAGTWSWPPEPERAAPVRMVGATGAGRTAPVGGAPGAAPPDRSHLLTEQRNPRTRNLHTLSAAECVALLQEIDRDVMGAMETGRGALTAFIEAVEPGFVAGGRLVYVGAGTSGRLGVLDASEAPPTFQVEPGRIVGIIAGGDAALRRSSEGKEDEPGGAAAELQALRLGARDAVLGIAAGGTTPFVLGALEHAGSLPAGSRPVTGLLVCSPVPRPAFVDHLVVFPTGPEALTGSTRMKAGTATKLALNAISTTLMVRSGRVYENLMVDLRATNDKLRDRAVRIVQTLTELTREEAAAVLAGAGWEVKTAIVMVRAGVAADVARARLGGVGGRIGAALGG